MKIQRYTILHRTYYNFSASVRLGPHSLRLRPREGHDLRVESAKVTIQPSADLRWHRDVEDNAVAIATFKTPTRQMLFESKVVIQQFNQAPLDFVVADYAVQHPFEYEAQDQQVLRPYMKPGKRSRSDALDEWLTAIWVPRKRVQTYTLLQQINSRIAQTLAYQRREEPGIQTPGQTLSKGTGSCRDFAYVFMETARRLGLAARFLSGYVHAPPSAVNFGATHAWAEVYLPGAGWKGFDPSTGELVGRKHIAVAVSRAPESVPPMAGSFSGTAEATLDVGVWVTELD